MCRHRWDRRAIARNRELATQPEEGGRRDVRVRNLGQSVGEGQDDFPTPCPLSLRKTAIFTWVLSHFRDTIREFAGS